MDLRCYPFDCRPELMHLQHMVLYLAFKDIDLFFVSEMITDVEFSRCRLRELNTLKGHVESVVRLKNLDVDMIQQSYTV